MNLLTEGKPYLSQICQLILIGLLLMEWSTFSRRENRSLPGVTRVANPYEVVDYSEQPIEEFTPSHPALPSPEWRAVYKKRFCNFRKNFNQPTIHVQYMPEGGGRKTMPDKQDRDLWWIFLSGRPEAEWNPPKKPRAQKKKQKSRITDGFVEHDETVLMYEESQSDIIVQEAPLVDIEREQVVPPSMFKGREPNPSLLKCIDERVALHLLMYFEHWFSLYLNETQRGIHYPTECHAKWIFSLLARIGDHISSDDIAMLRGLARACISILKQLLERLQPETLVTQEDFICERSCWIIISTVIDIWEQRDLWMDAENMLRTAVIL